MNTSSSFNINRLAGSNSMLKKVIRIGGQPPKMIVALHQSIVQQLQIDEQCWLEQIPTSEGIYLKILKGDLTI